nr:hypothetical protein CFP56_77604 [Quercus suber]
MFSRYPALAAAFVSLAAAQTTTPTSTSSTALASLWLPLDLDAVGAYSASVVNLCSDATTYQLSCSGDCVPYAPRIATKSELTTRPPQTAYSCLSLRAVPSPLRPRHPAPPRPRRPAPVDNLPSPRPLSFRVISTTDIRKSLHYFHISSRTPGQNRTETDERHSYQIPVTAGADKISKGTCTAGAVHAAAPVLFGAAAVGVLAAAIML